MFAKRWFSMFLAVVLLLTTLPVEAFATTAAAQAEELTATQAQPYTQQSLVALENENNILNYSDIWDGTCSNGFADGSGGKDDPYIIKTGAQLKYMAQLINSGANDFSGQYIQLQSNIDMASIPWEPVGTANAPFRGSFDGGHHELINICLRQGPSGKSDPEHIGFWGYIKNANIYDLGIGSFTVEKQYDTDTYIGGFVGYAEKSTITGCYANGVMQQISFAHTNPLNLDPVELTDVPEMCSYTNEHGQGQGQGQGVIIDLTDADPAINRTMTISGDVSAIRIIGNPDNTYTNFNIVIEENSRLSMLIELVNIKMQGSSSSGTIHCDDARPIYIQSIGTENAIFGASGSNAVQAATSALMFLGNAPLSIIGGNGTNANGVIQQNGKNTIHGASGTNGAAAVVAASVAVDMAAELTVTGGNGGNGFSGEKGSKGSPSYIGHSDRLFHGNGANGGKGGTGGTGGNGGIGGYAMQADEITIYTGTVIAVAGTSGNGGDGGKGGQGGKGQETGGWGSRAGNGGQGGDGGKGGDTYASYAVEADAQITVHQGTISLIDDQSAKPGSGGAVGDGGEKGWHCSKDHCGQWLTSGANGSPGSPGEFEGAAGNMLGIRTEDVTISQIADSSEGIFANGLRLARLTVGGFIGYLDENSVVEGCATLVNDLYLPSSNSDSLKNTCINKEFRANYVAAGNFVGEQKGILRNALAAYQDDGTCRLYNSDTWFGNAIQDNTAISGAFLLSAYTENDFVYTYTDPQGLVFDQQINGNNTVAWERTVLKKVGTSTSVSVPDQVYSGKFICNVTEIASSAFVGHSELEQVNLGNVYIIGSNILQGCWKVSTITIGKNLKTISDIQNQAPLFGIEKNTSMLHSYIVADENPAFCTVDGILYEEFNEIAVAVVDVPAQVPIVNYRPTDYVVRIYPHAFSYNRTIESVSLDYIRSVGNSAFFGASNLKTVRFGNYEPAEKEYVDNLAGRYATAAENYHQVIGNAAFKDCKSLSNVNLESDFITMVGVDAFANCAIAGSAKPLQITLGKKIRSIGATDDELINGKVNTYKENQNKHFAVSFEGTKIESFSVIEGNSHFTAIDGVLYFTPENTQELWLIIYPNCKSDLTYTVPDLTATSQNVTRVCVGAFRNTIYLETAELDRNVNTICDEAFVGSLVHSIHIGQNVQVISPYGNPGAVFDNCSNLTSINVHDDNLFYADVDGVFYDKTVSQLFKYPRAKAGQEFTAPATVREIWGRAFADNRLVRRITFPGEIDMVAHQAFYGCLNASIIYFQQGAAPFSSKSDVKTSEAFITGNGRTIVCYGSEDPSWEKLDDFYKSDDLNASVLYSIEKFVGYPEDKTSSGYYAFVVVDTDGNPLNNIYVELDEQHAEFGVDNGETIKTQAGIAMFYDLDYTREHTLRVIDNAGEYYPVVNEHFYLDEATRITYITMECVPVLSGISVAYNNNAGDKIRKSDMLGGSIIGLVETIGGQNQVVDIQSQPAKINKFGISELDILMNVGLESSYKILGYSLVQNQQIILTYHSQDDLDSITEISVEGDKYKETGKKLYQFTIHIDTAKLADGQDVYVVVEYRNSNAQSEQIQEKLNLQVFTMDWYPIDTSWATNEISFKVDSSVPFLGNSELKLTSKEKENYINYAVGDDFFRIIWGRKLKDFKFGDNYEKNKADSVSDLQNNWDSYVNAIKNGAIKEDALFEDSSSNKLGLSLGGYLEVKYKGKNDAGENDFEVSSSIHGLLKYKQEVGTTMQVFFVPVRVEVEVSLEGKLTFTLKFDDQIQKFVEPNLQFELKGGFEAYVGVGCSLISTGVYGELSSVLVVDIVPATGVKQWKISGDMGAYFKYEGLFVKFKKTWSLFDGLGFDKEITLYEDGIWWPETNPSAVRRFSSPDELYDSKNYRLATSDEFAAAYDGIDPELIRVGDLIYVVYHDNLNKGQNAKYDLYNYQKIVYQVYDCKGNLMSPTYVLDDNGFADGEFELYSIGDNVVIVYTQLSTRMEAEDSDNIEKYLSSIEIKTAVLHEGQFVPQRIALTQDDAYDMYVRIGQVNGAPAAVWVKNANNSMYGLATDENPSAIYTSIYNNGQWSEPVAIAENLGTITGLAVGNDEIAYITDSNNDLQTLGSDGVEGYSDRSICLIDYQGNVVGRTTQEDAYHGIIVLKDQLAYYKTGNLHTVSTTADSGELDGQAVLADEASVLPESSEVLYDAKGNVKGILFVKNVIYDEQIGSSGSNIFGIFCDSGNWGFPIQLTDYGQGVYVSSFDAVDLGSSMMLSVLKSSLIFENDSAEQFDDYQLISHFENSVVAYPGEFAIDKVDYSYDTIEKDKPVPLHIWVTNNGIENLTHIPVTVSCGETICYDGVATKFYDADGNVLTNGLLSGQSGYAVINFDPGFVTTKRYDVSVNGTATLIELWKSDLAVFGKQVKIGSEDYIIAYVTNLGYVDANVNLSAAYQGTELSVINPEDTLGYGEVLYFTIPLKNVELINDDVVTLTLDAQNEYGIANNTDSVVISNTPETKLQLESMHVQVSMTSAQIDRDNPVDFGVEYDSTNTLIGVQIGEKIFSAADGIFTSVQGRTTFYAEKLMQHYPNGIYEMKLLFDGASAYTPLELKITQFYQVTWIVDGISDQQMVEQGLFPEHINPEKPTDQQYSYQFIGWDSDGDGETDQLEPVTQSTVYTALFQAVDVQYNVIWRTPSGDQTEVYTYGQLPVYSGITPVKQPDVEYCYTFSGWDKEISVVTGNTVYVAQFTQTSRLYNITLTVGENKTTIQAAYGSIPQLPEPDIKDDAQYKYTFLNWSPEPSAVRGDQEYAAVLEKKLQQYPITWIIGQTSSVQYYPYGTIPVYVGDPIIHPDAQYSYQFIGWDQEPTAVTGAAEYTAVFDQSVNVYTVCWSVDGAITQQDYAYGEIPSFTGSTAKPTDDIYKYRFVGWDQTVAPVTGPITYTAIYQAIPAGRAQITNTSFETELGGSFSTTILLKDIQGMSTTSIMITYDPSLVSLMNLDTAEGVTVLSQEYGWIELLVEGMPDGGSMELITLSMRTADSTPPGANTLFVAQCDDILLDKFLPLTAYEIGKVESWNMTLSDDLTVNFVISVHKDFIQTAQVSLCVAEREQHYKVSEASYDETVGGYRFSISVAAAQMNDLITVRITSEGVQSVERTYTVRQYVQTILQDDAMSKCHQLVREMLHYGSAAQIYFGYNTEKLANEGITNAVSEDVPEKPAKEMSVVGQIDGICFYGTTLLFKHKVIVRYYFIVDKVISDFTFTSNGTQYTPVKKDGMYYVDVADLTPQDFDEFAELTVTDASGNTLQLGYSPLNYIVRMYPKGSQQLKLLLKAMYNYHLAAVSYTGKQ